LFLLIPKYALVIFLPAFINLNFSQQADILNSGSFRGELNGKKFENPIRYGTSENLFTIVTVNENFVLTINWRNISSISDIKKGITKLPIDDNSVIISFIDKKMGFPLIVTGGLLKIYQKDSRGLNGTLDFTALSRFPVNGKNYKVSMLNGNFRIDLIK